MRTTHTRISLLRLAVLYSFLPFFGLSLLINPGQITSVQGQEQTKLSLSSQESRQRVAIKRLSNLVKVLPAAQARPLINFLEVANTHLEMGQKVAACADQQNFINGVNALITAKQLDATQGKTLVDAASQIQTALGCSAAQVSTTGLLNNLTRLFNQEQHRVLHPSAQGGPDAFGYTFITNQPPGPTISSTFLDLNSTVPAGVVVGSGDNLGYTVPLAQSFNFYGTNYNSLLVSTNGYISTDLTDLGSDNTNDCPLPAAPSSGGGGRIYPLHDDLFLLGPGSRILQQFFMNCPRTNVGGGTEPCTVIMWDNAQFAFDDPDIGDIVPVGPPFDFEVILFHTSREIRVQVAAGNADHGATTTTGIQNPAATTGLTVACNTANSIPDNFAVSFILCSSITCPPNITTKANDPNQCGAVVTYPAPTGNAGCGVINCSPASGSFFPVGTTTVTCTSTAGPTCSFTVAVQDTQAPTITCPANKTQANDPNQCGAVVTYSSPTVSDNCPGVTVMCTPASGSFFPVGTTTVTCTASDASPNSPNASCTFTVTVQDTQAPVITCPANITTGTNSASGTAVTYTTTASDNCPGVTVTCTPASGSNFPVGSTTVNCTASDASPNSPDATCSFAVTVIRVTYTISDPLACTGPGNVVNGTFTIPNTGGAPVTVTATATLPAGLIGQVGSCTANILTTCTVNPTSVSYTATIPAGQTATVSYQAQVADFVTIGTQLCSTLTATFGGGGAALTLQACITANCPAVGPGTPFPVPGEVSDQRAGSVLVYNLYSSSIAAPNAQNTRISITNTHPSLRIAVHLFFVDGATCSIADSLVCLTPNQTASFLASDIDPGTTGYVVAVASSVATGCPIDFNYLIGDEYVKLSSGHAANLAAEGFAALAGSVPICNALSVTALLSFDGTNYNRAPRVLAASNVPSRADGNDTLIVLNRFGGSLVAGASTLGSIFGILYDDAENPLSFTFTAGVCQFRSSLSSNFPRVAPRFEQFIPAGRSGWAKFYSQSDIALLGAQINFNANAGTAANAFNQGHNLHKLTLTTAATLTIPIFPPNC